jgi:pimeloyl-ACP methyl ester carboxylesterase
MAGEATRWGRLRVLSTAVGAASSVGFRAVAGQWIGGVRDAGRVARKWVALPRWPASAQPLALFARDGTPIHGVRLPGPEDAPCTVVVVHGVTNNSRTPTMFRFALQVATWAHVVTIDLRGHGASGGRSSLGALEHLDVAAAVAAARAAAPDLPVVAVGTSLGASAALVAAGRHGGLAGVVAVSPPAWRDMGPPSAARLGWWAATPAGRLGLRVVTGTRVPARWPVTADLAAAVAAISPAFVLIVHDPSESHVRRHHPEAIYGWARPPKDIWWVDGAGHGAGALGPELTDRIRREIITRISPTGPG